MIATTTLCPISRHDVPTESWEQRFNENRDIEIYDCPWCGEFAMARLDALRLRNEFDTNQQERQQVWACLRERKLRGAETPVVKFGEPSDQKLGLPILMWADLLTVFPKTVSDRLNRILLNLKGLSPHPGSHIQIDNNFRPVAFAETESAMRWVLHTLQKQNYLDYLDQPGHNYLVITAEGWAHIAELESARKKSLEQAFVAMRMDDEWQSIYKGIEDGIRAAGYTPFLVLKDQYNDQVDDRIIAAIAESRFIVADFTGHRQSVYYEAGFARGLGTPVIFTCKKSDIKEAHFDTRQYNHILWETPEELAELLKYRIAATIRSV